MEPAEEIVILNTRSEEVDPQKLTLHPTNPRQGDVGMIVMLFKANGFYGRVVVDERTGYVLAGNHRVKAALALSMPLVPVEYVETRDDDHATAIMLADNRASDVAANDEALLTELLEGLAKNDGLQGSGFDLEDLDELLASVNGQQVEVTGGEEARLTLAERFVVPPFTVLDARQGYWQDRKRAWIALGIESEVGRGGGITWGDSPAVTERGLNFYRSPDKGLSGLAQDAHVSSTLGAIAPNEAGADGILTRTGKYAGNKNGLLGESDHSRRAADRRSNLNNAPKTPDCPVGTGTENMAAGTSIFDPVLCELAYTWFTAKGAKVLDPFAGGSVRGIVAAWLGRSYTGIDLRPEQIAANEEQARQILGGDRPCWIVGDSKDAMPDERVDFVFSCPPYYDLERYSDDPADLSNADDYAAFLTVYREIIAQAVGRLNDNRFACFVVGDVRDKAGNYYNFVGDTVKAFLDAGCKYYNEAVLVTAVGSLPIRVGRQFAAGRKLGKTHQNVLVFVKGDGKKAAQWCGEVEVGDLESLHAEPAT